MRNIVAQSSSAQLGGVGFVSSAIRRAEVQFGRRYRQGRALLKTDGVSAVSRRLLNSVADLLKAKDQVLPVRRSDVIEADLSKPFRPPVPEIVPGRPIALNWVMTPPSRGSGGHTTLFRMIRYLEMHGYANRVYFYDVYRGDHAYYEAIVRGYYGFTGKVATVDAGMDDAHAVFATGWPTAYPAFNSRCSGKRFYFVQDFEPYFFPAGSMSFLAQNTYRMGFHAITVGRCFAERLQKEFGMVVDCLDYGCDTSQYRRSPDSKRSGVVFYARRETPRRGFELGLMALEVLAARQPQIDIHIYGDKLGKLPFRFIDHGRLTPEQINDIYNRCYAGLSLSFTNVSLVAQEMLAAGCIPVVNDTTEVRTDFTNPFVRYISPYPAALAAELEAVTVMQNFESVSAAAASSVLCASWDDAAGAVDALLRRTLQNGSGAVQANQDGYSTAAQ